MYLKILKDLNISDLVTWYVEMDDLLSVCLPFAVLNLIDRCLATTCLSKVVFAFVTVMLILNSSFPMISGAEFRTVWWCSIFSQTCHMLSHVTHSWLRPYFSCRSGEHGLVNEIPKLLLSLFGSFGKRHPPNITLVQVGEIISSGCVHPTGP